jgi:hypothetical protein
MYNANYSAKNIKHFLKPPQISYLVLGDEGRHNGIVSVVKLHRNKGAMRLRVGRRPSICVVLAKRTMVSLVLPLRI